MTDTVELPIKITPSAADEIRMLYNKLDNKEQTGLRIGVEGGGCAGFAYILTFDTKKENDNQYFLEKNIALYIDKSQMMYLYGTTIDFKGGLDNRGFIYDNPNATGVCGCGTSFSV
jgi:iron-sulfur cluster assembly protein